MSRMSDTPHTAVHRRVEPGPARPDRDHGDPAALALGSTLIGFCVVALICGVAALVAPTAEVAGAWRGWGLLVGAVVAAVVALVLNHRGGRR